MVRGGGGGGENGEGWGGEKKEADESCAISVHLSFVHGYEQLSIAISFKASADMTHEPF